MNPKLEYFSKILPAIWEENKDKFIEKNGVYLVKNEKDDYPKWTLILYPALSEEEIFSIENKLKVSFPEEYRNFLLSHNGIEFFDDLVLWGKAKTYNEKEFLSQELDLIEKQEEYSLGWEIKKGEVIIANDSLGIYVLNTQTGKIVVHDTEFPDNEEEYDSLKEFLTDRYKMLLESQEL